MQVLLRPSSAFVALKNDPYPLKPILVVLGALAIGSACMALAEGIAAAGRFGDHTVEHRDASLRETSSLERVFVQDETATEAMGSPLVVFFMVLTSITLAGVLYFTGVLTVATYLYFIVSGEGRDLGFYRWFSLSCWASTPLVLTATGMVVDSFIDAISNDSIRLLAPLTWLDVSAAGYAAVARIDLVWIVVLMSIGVRTWLQRSAGFAWTVTVIPALIYMVTATELARLTT